METCLLPDLTNDGVGRILFWIDRATRRTPNATIGLVHEEDSIPVIEEDAGDRRKNEKFGSYGRAKTSDMR